MDVDGVEIVEQAEEYGYSWSWDDPRGFQSEILWNREAGSCNLGTRMLPGGWVHTHLDSAVWGTSRTIYEAREVVGRYVFQAAARPA